MYTWNEWPLGEGRVQRSCFEDGKSLVDGGGREDGYSVSPMVVPLVKSL